MVQEAERIVMETASPTTPDDVEMSANAGIYVVRFTGESNPAVNFRFDRFYEANHKTHCECTVLSRVKDRTGEITTDDLILTGALTQKRLASALTELWTGWDWPSIVRRAVKMVRDHYRAGEPVRDLLASEPTDEALPWQVSPLALQGFPTVLYGPPGVGKGYMACFLALSIAEGLSECGLSVSPGNVLYLDYEASDRDIQQRLWMLHRGLFDGPADGLGRVIYRACSRPITHDAPELVRLVVEHKISAIIVDSAAPASGQPQDDDAVTATYSALRGMRPTDTAPPATPIIIAHQAKNATEKTPFGSIMWSARARDVFWVNGAETPGALTVSLQHVKANNRRRLSPLAYRFEFGGRDIRVSRALATDVPELEAQLPLWRRLQNILRRGAMPVSELAERTLIPPASPATHRSVVDTELRRHPGVFVQAGQAGAAVLWGLVSGE